MPLTRHVGITRTGRRAVGWKVNAKRGKICNDLWVELEAKQQKIAEPSLWDDTDHPGDYIVEIKGTLKRSLPLSRLPLSARRRLDPNW